MSPAEYLERLRLRAAKGDPDAEAELADWERIHPRPTFGATVKEKP